MPRRALLAALVFSSACGAEPAPAGSSVGSLDTTSAPPVAPRDPAAATAVAPAPSVPPAVAALPAASAAALASSPVAMLVLPEPYAAGSVVTSGPHWAALSFQGDGVTVSLHATDVSHDVLTAEELARLPAPEASVRGRPARIAVNELIRSVSWDEGPVSYSLEVECARPAEDRRCTEDRFLLELGAQLVEVPR